MWCCLTRRQDRLVLPWLHGLLSDYPECVRSTYCVMIDWFRDCVVQKYKVVAGNRGYTYTSGFLLNTMLGLHGVHFLFCQREKKSIFWVLRAVSLDVDSFPLGYLLLVLLDYVSNTKTTTVGNGWHIHNTLSPEMRLAPADHQNKYFVKHGGEEL